jgi:hypothetical protein
MAQENTDAGFDLARELAGVQTPSEYVEVWNAWARGAYETLSEQTKELSALGQKVVAQPLTNGFKGTVPAVANRGDHRTRQRHRVPPTNVD